LDALTAEEQCFVLVPGADAIPAVAAALPRRGRSVLVVDDAHSVPRLSGLALVLADEQWCNVKIVLTLRPGFTADVLERLGIPLSAADVLPVDRLPRAAVNQILLNEPHRIGDTAARRHIIYLSQGNPLIAHMAATALRETGLHARSAGAFFREYLRLWKRTPDELVVLALAALLAPFNPNDHTAMITALHPLLGITGVTATANALSDQGVLDFGRGAFVIKPDALTPVIVADVFFPEKAAALIPIERVLEYIPQGMHRNVVERLAAATQCSDSRGVGVLAAQVEATFPPADCYTPGPWISALEFCATYAFALPSSAAHLLTRLDRSVSEMFEGWSQQDRSRVADAVSTATRSLADDVPMEAVALVLSLAALDLRFTTGPRKLEEQPLLKSLLEFFKHSSRIAAARLATRNGAFVRAIAAWHSRARGTSEQRSAAAIAAVATAHLMRLHFEFSEESAASANTFELGVFETPLSEPMLTVVRRAAAVTAELVQDLDEAAVAAVLRCLGEITHISEHGYLMGGAHASQEAREELRRAVVEVVRSLSNRWSGLSLATRYGLLRFRAFDASISRHARRDDELRLFAAFYPAREMGRNYPRWQTLVAARARRLSLLYPGLRGLELAERMLAAGDPEANPAGLYPFLVELAAQANESESQALVAAMLRSIRLREATPLVLGLALQQHPLALMPIVLEITSSDSTSGLAARVLDSLGVSDENVIIAQLLAAGPDARAAAASHLVMCSRVSTDRKYELLIRSCEGLIGYQLGQMLARIGEISYHAKELPPPALRHLLVAELARFMATERDVSAPHLWLEPVFNMLGGFGIEEVLRVVTAYISAGQRSLGSGRLYARLSRDLCHVLEQLSPDEKALAATAIAAKLERLEAPYIFQGGLWGIVRAAAPGERYVELLERWAASPETRELAVEGIRGTCPSPEFERVARALLASAESERERRQVLSAVQPRQWSGSRSPALRQSVVAFREWAKDTDPVISEFGRIAAEQFDKEAAQEESEEAAREEGY
jgi:hypothetical protein